MNFFAIGNLIENQCKSNSCPCCSIAWKLAFLNPDLLVGKRELLQRSVDTYMEHFEDKIHAPRPGVRLMKETFESASIDPLHALDNHHHVLSPKQLPLSIDVGSIEKAAIAAAKSAANIPHSASTDQF